MHKKILGWVLVSALTACGGSDEGDGSHFVKSGGSSSDDDVTRNVAWDQNGGEIKSATYDKESAKFAIDGINTSSNFWAGNAKEDRFVIRFEDTVELDRIDIWTNVSSYDLTDPPIILELSTNNRTWRSFMASSGDGGIQCVDWGIYSNGLRCTVTKESARYVRITTRDGSINIYEVEAIGK